MNSKGWIKLYRKILENPVVCKDAEYFAVWNYLMLKATHQGYKDYWNGKELFLQPGQLITGRRIIAEKFKINESKVQRILKLYESEQQIEQRTNNQNRLISIVNWNKYETSEQQTEQQKQQFSDDIYKIYDYVVQFFPEKLRPNTTHKKEKWLDTIDKLIRIDGRNKKEIYYVVKWARNDEFWQDNFRSLTKLRQKDRQDTMYYDVFVIQMNKKKKESKNDPTRAKL